LPAQGLVIEQKPGVLLESTEGKVIGRLAGFSIYPPQKLSDAVFARTAGMQALATADPGLTVLFDRQGSGWLLRPGATRLQKIGPIRVPLVSGSSLSVVVTRRGAGVDTRVVVRRHGKVALSGLFVHIASGRYAATDDSISSRPNEVVDLVTGRRTQLGPRCLLAGFSGNAAIAGCSPAQALPSLSAHVYAYEGGSKRLLATLPPGLQPSISSVSPDGRWVVVYLEPFCGAGWVAVMPSAGGSLRLAVGGVIGRTIPSTRVPHTSVLGWTADGRVAIDVARLNAGTGCEGLPETGVSLVDPGTLAPTHVTPLFAAMLWGAQ
jgi:hypothetical protein